MRVGLVCPYSFAVPGGVQNHVLELAAALRGLGHDVSVLGPGDAGDGGQAGSAPLPAYVTTVGRAIPVPYNGSVARVSFGPLVAAQVRRWVERGRFDVIHIHEPATPSVSVLALWAARCPVVATFHTAQERPRALETSAATFLRSGLDKIAAHIAVSAEAETTLRRYRDVETRVIPNGVDTARFARAAAETPRTLLDDGPHLAFVGRTDEPRKGLPVLLRALPRLLERHPDLRLHVVGSDGLEGVLRRAVARHGDSLVVHGRVDDDAKAAVLAAADLYVAPHTGGESFGIVLVEALAAGTPVVASDLPAFEAVLGGTESAAMFPVGEHHRLASTVLELLDDRARLRRMSASAAGAATAYDWTTVTPRVAEVYDAVRSSPVSAAG